LYFAIVDAERYDEARPTAGATGASAAGVPLAGVCSGDWLNEAAARGRGWKRTAH
jgi:hypothetical protein